MEKTHDTLSSNQKYSAIRSEDIEETVSEEYVAHRAASVLATHEPRRSAWYLAARFLTSREVLTVHLMWLLLLVLAIFCLRLFTSDMNCAVSRLPSDEVFGEIPFRVVSWEQDMAFVNSDPMDGKRWNQSRESEAYWTPWDDIHPGSWVRIKPFPKLDISGGIPLREYSQDGSWDTDDEGFALSMHHQIHCLGLIKHSLIMSELNKSIPSQDFRHTDHCVEYIRQAILCHGDLTLEALEPGSKRLEIESDTWGSKHYCRDWNVLKEVVWKHTTVGFDIQGFVFDKEIR